MTIRRAIGTDFEPVWPEKWPAERLRARQGEIGSASFARGYRLVPIADEETPIRAAWVRFWTDPADYDAVLLSVDPAVSSSLKADRSALVVLARTAAPGAPETARLEELAARSAACRRRLVAAMAGITAELGADRRLRDGARGYLMSQSLSRPAPGAARMSA